MKKNNPIQQTLTLVRKDLLLELRQQYAFYGVLLYIVSTVFVINLMMGKPDEKLWNALFWVIQLFVAVNAVAKSFMQESKGRLLYFYSLVHPRYFIVAKLIYNIILMTVMSLIALGCSIMLLGNPITNAWYFVGVVLLGGISLSLLFTMLAAIAAQANHSAALMAVMGFPLILPVLMLLANISLSAFLTVYQPDLPKTFLLLGGMDLLVIALSMILFPYLWKD
ncbi:heme exporter protein CcmB [Chitinophaga sp. Cy-1792]|uniref:heme exporter protein CcmB n=1 Tax=Chitinophaga sp. Cy-1792 TaxID=2608339 RepID=UPI00141F5AA4|nr:heme exporter protein CcmB [Chitinophaga sp. Cy-1792]NIG56916.1 cytochrome C biogenesis protein [Chitinophaga sp. Cy-1792]